MISALNPFFGEEQLVNHAIGELVQSVRAPFALQQQLQQGLDAGAPSRATAPASPGFRRADPAFYRNENLREVCVWTHFPMLSQQQASLVRFDCFDARDIADMLYVYPQLCKVVQDDVVYLGPAVDARHCGATSGMALYEPIAADVDALERLVRSVPTSTILGSAVADESIARQLRRDVIYNTVLAALMAQRLVEHGDAHHHALQQQQQQRRCRIARLTPEQERDALRVSIETVEAHAAVESAGCGAAAQSVALRRVADRRVVFSQALAHIALFALTSHKTMQQLYAFGEPLDDARCARQYVTELARHGIRVDSATLRDVIFACNGLLHAYAGFAGISDHASFGATSKAVQ